jgi:hypothetical protein
MPRSVTKHKAIGVKTSMEHKKLYIRLRRIRAHCRHPHQRGGGEEGGDEGVPGAHGCSGYLDGAATTAWATTDAGALHSAGYATSRGQNGAMGRLARSCTRVAGVRAAYLGLGSRDANPPTRASTAAHSQLAMATGALHRPLRR